MKKSYSYVCCLISVLALILLGSTTGCNILGPPLTNTQIQQFISVFQTLNEKGIDYSAEEGNIHMETGTEEYEEFEKVVLDAGFSDMIQFTRISAKIGIAYAMIEGKAYQERMEALNETDAEQDEDLQQMLDNPDLTDEEKQQIQTAMENTTQAKEEWEANKEIAEPMMDFAGNFVGEEEVALVKKYYPQLKAVFAEAEAQGHMQD